MHQHGGIGFYDDGQLGKLRQNIGRERDVACGGAKCKGCRFCGRQGSQRAAGSGTKQQCAPVSVMSPTPLSRACRNCVASVAVAAPGLRAPQSGGSAAAAVRAGPAAKTSSSSVAALMLSRPAFEGAWARAGRLPTGGTSAPSWAQELLACGGSRAAVIPLKPLCEWNGAGLQGGGGRYLQNIAARCTKGFLDGGVGNYRESVCEAVARVAALQGPPRLSPPSWRGSACSFQAAGVLIRTKGSREMLRNRTAFPPQPSSLPPGAALAWFAAQGPRRALQAPRLHIERHCKLTNHEGRELNNLQ